MIKTDGIILDIDGTLWNTTGVVAKAWNKAIADCGFDAALVNASGLQKEFGKPMNVIADDLWPALSQEQKDLLMKQCCVREQEALKENREDISYPAVRDTIKALAQKFRLYIVSNCQSGYIELTMEKNKIADFISDHECYGDTGMGKADNLRLLVRRNGIKAPVYVGDTQGDADACREAGVKFVWAGYGFGSVQEFAAKIDRFDQLLDLFQNLD
ncbi:MAG: HAD family hydrolase [Treponema sp.]|nr:HAD family hydrolase [Treponema sp.]